MGARGPQPDPFSQRTLRGVNTFKPREIVATRSEPFELPSELDFETNRAAANFWRSHEATCRAAGTLTEQTIFGFLELCLLFQQVSTLRLQQTLLQKEAILLAQSTRRLDKLMALFGFFPSRAAMLTAPTKEQAEAISRNKFRYRERRTLRAEIPTEELSEEMESLKERAEISQRELLSLLPEKNTA